jgi:ribonuclease BN (tRNA processing enzyme)
MLAGFALDQRQRPVDIYFPGPAARPTSIGCDVRPEGRVVLDDVSVHRPGQKFAFVMGTGPCDAAISLADGADLLVCESTFLDADQDLARR